jgi:hypothetical protein
MTPLRGCQQKLYTCSFGEAAAARLSQNHASPGIRITPLFRIDFRWQFTLTTLKEGIVESMVGQRAHFRLISVGLPIDLFHELCAEETSSGK